MFSRFIRWIDERWPLSPFVRLALEEEMAGGSSYAYVFGSAALIVFSVQALTGIWQLFIYVPTLSQGYNSLNYLRTEVPFGWLVHGLHYWGANAMVVLVMLHVSQVFIWGAYKRPHELQWVTGVVLFLLTMVMSLTGGALPWDKRSYWLVEVASSAAGTVPLIGETVKRLMLGGGAIGQLTLSRFFILHAALVAGTLFTLAAVHLVALRKVGNAGPWSGEARQKAGPFWPDQVFKDGLVAGLIVLLLVALSVFFPPPYAGMADPLDASYIPKPEWNFLFFYQALKFFPGPLEAIATVGIPLVGTLVLLLVPFVDRDPERRPLRRPIAMAGWAVAVALFVGLTLAGAYSKPEGADGTATGQSAPPSPPAAAAGAPAAASRGHAPPPAAPAAPAAPEVKEGKPATASGRSAPPAAPAGQVRAAAVPQGRQAAAPSAGEKATGAGGDLFRSQGCTVCHRVGATGGNIGPDLSGEGLKGRSREWLSEQLHNPKARNPSSVMPSFASLGEEKIGQLVDYLLSLKEGKPATSSDGAAPATPPAGGTPPAAAAGKAPAAAIPEGPHGEPGLAATIIGSTEHGAILFENACASCHGPRGTGKVQNPGSKEGVVPSLNPIDEDEFSPDPKTFAEKIDLFIQHGSRPEGSNPLFSMLPFGDTHALTQQQIADLEAYILSVNGVDRAKIYNPGVDPEIFFIVAAFVFALFAINLLGGWWFGGLGRAKKGRTGG